MNTAALRGDGTTETAWRRWAAPASWDRLRLDLTGRAVVVSPHPDDETLGVGGLLWSLRRLRCPVVVVAVTDGEGSHPPTPRRSSADLARQRRAEQVAALSHLDVDASQIVRLGMPDTSVSECESDLAAVLASLTGADDWLIAPWEADGHRDHDAAGRAACRAAAATGVRLLRYPVWAWHWATPAHPALRSWRPLRFDLPDTARRAKARAVGCYRSQISATAAGDPAIVPGAMLDRHRRPWEAVLT